MAKFPEAMEEGEDKAHKAIFLAASCGCGGAMQYVSVSKESKERKESDSTDAEHDKSAKKSDQQQPNLSEKENQTFRMNIDA